MHGSTCYRNLPQTTYIKSICRFRKLSEKGIYFFCGHICKMQAGNLKIARMPWALIRINSLSVEPLLADVALDHEIAWVVRLSTEAVKLLLLARHGGRPALCLRAFNMKKSSQIGGQRLINRLNKARALVASYIILFFSCSSCAFA